MKRTNYKKIVKDVFSSMSRKEYNAWLKKGKPLSRHEMGALISGIRIGVGLKEQKNWEELQELIPMSDEDERYYSSLPDNRPK